MKIRGISKENLKLKLNQYLLREFGMNICLGGSEKLNSSKYKINLTYCKIFSLVDEPSKTIYLRALRFDDIYSFDYKLGSKFDVRKEELTDNISAEFSRLRNEIATSVLKNKPLILKLIRNVPSISHFLNKFVYLITNLVNQDKIEAKTLNELIRRNPRYKKYVELLIDMKFANYNEYNDLITTNKTRKMLEDNKGGDKCKDFIHATVDEILYSIIKENLNYVTNILKLPMIKPLINVISCIHFFTKYLKMEKLTEISLERFHKIYENLIEKTSKERLDKILTSLTYSGIIRKQPSEENLRLIAYL